MGCDYNIELFFKALKQNLKIKTFVGTSENAVNVQIWTALIAMLLLKYLLLKSAWAWSLSNLAAMLRFNLLSYRDLWALLGRDSETSFTAFAVNCTHLGCPVNWLEDARLFLCPCHGGVYNADGSVAAGPPPHPLPRYEVRVQNGQVEILARGLQFS